MDISHLIRYDDLEAELTRLLEERETLKKKQQALRTKTCRMKKLLRQLKEVQEVTQCVDAE